MSSKYRATKWVPKEETITEETMGNLNNSVGNNTKPPLPRTKGYITAAQAQKIYEMFHAKSPSQIAAIKEKMKQPNPSGGRRTRRNRTRRNRTRRQ